MATTSKNPPRVISASRRSDLPAYYADWFMQQVERGYAIYPNPVSFKPVRISLRPEEVICIVFWTRNPHPLEKYLDRLDELYQQAFYFLFTINGMPRNLETNNPPLEFAIAAFLRLAERYPGRVFWRYDPIVLSDLTPPDYHMERFAQLAERLRHATPRCYFSFVNWYAKVRRNFAKASQQHGVKFRDADLAERLEIVRRLVPVATANGMRLYSCCQHALCQIDGVMPAHCVDLEIIRKIAPDRYRRLREAPTREDCGCYESRDIGWYDSCPHGCIYCYANLNREKAKAFYHRYLQNRALPLDMVDADSLNC
ncbi:MAG: DUF1848 domain-containing protein [candidate division KSB1 bacterium]|nr:DUF1848 domain-containing protein [candidate division KSB1 bacterium]MDZ7303384.1 DUF1848 domain-containing protein [candidate division KSB1 bacterium]MDZ7312298.1 DUF1848 domain-containing protein [candidate division KSB1 bacterium]